MQTKPLGTFRHGFGDDYWKFEEFEDDGVVVRERTDCVLRGGEKKVVELCRKL
jgi:hypothetical protein